MSEVCGGDSAASQPGFGASFTDIPKVIKVLITNPTFMFLNCAGASEGNLHFLKLDFLIDHLENELQYDK